VLHAAGFEAEARAEWERAADRLERRLAHDENERIRSFLAAIYARLDRAELAREQIRRSLDVKPGEPATRFFAAEVYAVLGDRAAALDALRQSVAGGFIGLPVVEYYEQEPNGLAAFSHDREYLSIRDGMARRIAELRARF